MEHQSVCQHILIHNYLNLIYLFKIRMFLITLFVWLHAKNSILLTCGKYLHDRIISVSGEVRTNITTIM